MLGGNADKRPAAGASRQHHHRGIAPERSEAPANLKSVKSL